MPAASAAATARSAAATSAAIGFSQKTCFPASAAAAICSGCSGDGEQRRSASMSSRPSSSRQSSTATPPNSAARAEATPGAGSAIATNRSRGTCAAAFSACRRAILPAPTSATRCSPTESDPSSLLCETAMATSSPVRFKSPLHEMVSTTATDFWNDSCSIEELTYAIEHGAVGATSNPTIVGEVLAKEMHVWRDRILELIAGNPTWGEDEVTWALLEEIAVRGAELLTPGSASWTAIEWFERAYPIFREWRYRTRLLAAAYRNHLHWSQLFGGDVVLTIPAMWQRLFNASEIEVRPRMDDPVPTEIV